MVILFVGATIIPVAIVSLQYCIVGAIVSVPGTVLKISSFTVSLCQDYTKNLTKILLRVVFESFLKNFISSAPSVDRVAIGGRAIIHHGSGGVLGRVCAVAVTRVPALVGCCAGFVEIRIISIARAVPIGTRSRATFERFSSRRLPLRVVYRAEQIARERLSSLAEGRTALGTIRRAELLRSPGGLIGAETVRGSNATNAGNATFSAG